MINRVRTFIKEQEMLAAGDRVIIGLSGGADSVCLFLLLLDLREEFTLEMEAVHVHHGLRGQAADADEAFCRALCKRKEVPYHCFHVDVRSYAKKQGLSEEEAGRDLRRSCFQTVAAGKDGVKIALAHHKNDNAETLLMNLCRGSGFFGLGGMEPKTGIWIRPLLCLERTEIEDWLLDQEQDYCTDATNFEREYTRNRIRIQVLPYLQSEVNAKAIEHMNDSMAQLRELGGFLKEQIDAAYQGCVRREGEGLLLQKEAYEEIPVALRSYVLHKALCEAAGKKKDLSRVHMEALSSLFQKQVGRQIDLPYGIQARREYQGLRLLKKESFAPHKEEQTKLQMRKFPLPEGKTFPESRYTKWFDYDIIRNTVKIRHREPGDYIRIDRTGKKQKLKQYFINEKIPQQLRDEIWLVADGKEIMWVVGYRQNQAYQITENTKCVLEIQYQEES